MPKSFFFFLTAFIFIFSSCNKSTDSNTNNSDAPFSIIENATNHAEVHGNYVFWLPCDTSHYISVPVQVNEPGSWTFETDSVDGLRFRGSGTFTANGLQWIKLYGTGIPINTEIKVLHVKIGGSEASVSINPVKAFLDITYNGARDERVERPSDDGKLRVGGEYADDGGVIYPRCIYYNAVDLFSSYQLLIDYRGFPSYQGVEESLQWDAYAPARHNIADVNSPDDGFRFTFRFANQAPYASSDKVVNDNSHFVDIISRGQFTSNIMLNGIIEQIPVYVIKIRFNADVGDGVNAPSPISGEAIAFYTSVNGWPR